VSAPLDGLLVVSMEQAVSAPFTTRQLADLGARVIKVERPDGGDFARGFDTLASGLGTHFTWVNRNKESLTLDTKQPAATNVLFELLARADVFVQNLAPGAAERAGLDGLTLQARFPRLIICEISGYGSSGPYADRRAYDLLIQAEAAVATITGDLENPIKPGIAVADIAAGMYAHSAILAALLTRARTNQGTVVEVAMPYDAYVSRDGHRVVLSVQNDREWVRLAAQVLDRAELADDPRFATNAVRVEHRAEIDALLAPVLGALDIDTAIATLTTAGIACARINTVRELVDHPQLVERGRWAEMGSPVGMIPTLLPPVISSTWSPALGPVPALGEHTDRVLGELGRSPADIAALRASGAV
jgi:itaconate CoA-transferase